MTRVSDGAGETFTVYSHPSFYSVWKVCNNIRNCWRRSSSSLVISDRVGSGMWGRSSATYSSSKSANAHLSAENTRHVYRFSSGKSRTTLSAASSPTALLLYALIKQSR
jgi:hypothetical protein